MSARIDLYLNSLVKFNATAVVLSSGGNVTLRFPAGDRMASQTTAHAELVALVEEIAPGGALPALRQNAPTRFPYEAGGKTFLVGVEPKGGAWMVTLEPAPAGMAAASTPKPTVTAAADDGLLIERTSYGSVEAKKPSAAASAPPAPSVVAAPAPTPTPALAPTPAHAAPPVEAPRVSATPGQLLPIEKMLVQMKESGCSDLHLSTNVRPMVRQHGEMKPLGDHPAMDAEAMMQLLLPITPEKNRIEFGERSDSDFAHSIPGVSRFRANLFRDRHGPGAVFRAIPFQILSPEQLGLPKGVLDLCYLTKGLVVVTGPTGSGKSTTLATLIDYVNRNRHDHIITIEDPIEFVHDNKNCLVNQREVHTHTRSFKDALRAALREDPDIVLVGEMRDLETIAIAVETAETGHLVFGTLHTTTAPSTIDRIIDQFPADRQEQIRQMVSESLRGVIAQTLCKKIGGGRVAAYEILVGSSAVSNLIRESKTFQLFSLMQTGRSQGMITLNDSLFDLVKRKIVDPKEAYMKSVQKQEFKNLLAREGIKVDLTEAT